MPHLSNATVREIISLAEARFAAIPRNQTQEQILDRILGNPNPQELALRGALNKLDHHQALCLVATMYAGRYLVENEQFENAQDDDYSEDQAPEEKYEEIYQDHFRNFHHRDVAALISLCEDKTEVLHRYLKAALDRQ